MSNQPIVCALGRYGDVMNALPIAWHLHEQTGIKTKFVISKEFWKILDGTTYTQPVVWDIRYNEIPRAMAKLAGTGAIICQTHSHPDNRRLTDSYQKESWRVAGWLDSFGKLPLVFDNRNKDMEAELSVHTIGDGPKKPIILLSGKSMSSPLDFAPFAAMIAKELGDNNQVIDISNVKADAIYDMLGLFDRAAVLVTIDTMHLHMARASKVPVVALINNGWLGSVPLANVKATFRYADANPRLVVDAIKEIVP